MVEQEIEEGGTCSDDASQAARACQTLVGRLTLIKHYEDFAVSCALIILLYSSSPLRIRTVICEQGNVVRCGLIFSPILLYSQMMILMAMEDMTTAKWTF